MPVRKSQKIEAQVVEAIRKLQAVQGSTPREISNYIAQEYDIADSEIRRHVQLALKRGVVYGILQRLKGQVSKKEKKKKNTIPCVILNEISIHRAMLSLITSLEMKFTSSVLEN
ncbi:hypothetical protein ANTPLA_LOCUS2770 [Anthophora plagiata]